MEKAVLFAGYHSFRAIMDLLMRTAFLFAFWYIIMLVFVGTYHPALHLVMTGASSVFSSVGLSWGLLS